MLKILAILTCDQSTRQKQSQSLKKRSCISSFSSITRQVINWLFKRRENEKVTNLNIGTSVIVHGQRLCRTLSFIVATTNTCSHHYKPNQSSKHNKTCTCQYIYCDSNTTVKQISFQAREFEMSRLAVINVEAASKVETRIKSRTITKTRYLRFNGLTVQR